MIDGWMPSVGSSSTSSFGSHDQRAADRQLLLLAAGQVAAPAAQHLLEDREQLEDVVGNLRARRAAAAEAGLQILLDRQQREDLAALRHVARCRAARARSVGSR